MSVQPEPPAIPWTDEALANDTDLDRALNDWPPTDNEGEQQ